MIYMEIIYILTTAFVNSKSPPIFLIAAPINQRGQIRYLTYRYWQKYVWLNTQVGNLGKWNIILPNIYA